MAASLPDLRPVLDAGDVARLRSLLADHSALAVQGLQPTAGHPLGAAPINYVAMLRFDTSQLVWRDVTGTAAMARALVAAGAPVDGQPGDTETPLMTAASYGDAEVARVLVEAGADLERTAAPDAGGVPGGTALLHAAVFGMTAVLDLLVAAGAAVPGPVLGAATGDLSRWPLDAVSDEDRPLALIMAADHERLGVIDQLIAAGTPVDAVDPTWGRHPLRLAAANGRPAAVRRLLDHGADPNLTDDRGRTPLALSRAGHAAYPTHPGHAQVQAMLEPLTR